MSVGLIALAVPFLGPLGSVACAVGAVLFNLFLLPRLGGRRLWRRGETERGRSVGIVLYPVAILLLILIFWRRLEVAAAVWGILAFGDGMASVVGMAFGRRKLPWNADKSWLGTAAYWLFGTVGATFLLCWTVHHQGGEIALGFALAACAGTALFAALLESQPQGLDDNIGVPLVTGFVLLGLLQGEVFWASGQLTDLLPQMAVGVGVNVLLALLGYLARGVDRSGAVGGFLVGTLIYGFLGWRGYLLLLAFFVLGTGASKLGYKRKAKANLAQEGGGRRSARHAFANSGAAALLAGFAASVGPDVAEIYLLAFAAAFATAAGDTLSSELGQLWGRRTFLVTTLRPVPRGTEGAVSLEGTLAGIAGSAILAAIGWAVGFYGAWGIAVVVVAAFVGTTLESVVGATLERRGLLDNEAVNFLNTLTGALAAALLALALR